MFDAGTEEELNLPDDGAFISQKMAEDLDLQTGDTFEITLAGEEVHEIPISGVVKNHIDNFLYMKPEVYSSFIGDSSQLVENNYWLKTNDESETDQEVIGQTLMEEDEVVNITFTDTVRSAFGETLDALNLVVFVLILAAALLAFIVLYNLTNINIGERIGELSTIKVLGFYDKEVTMYIYRENMFLTLLGILVGFGMGALLHRYIILTVENSVLMFGRTILWPSYLYSALLTLLFAAIVMLVMHRLLKKVDMVEALKAED
jgi:putative ABC transport system permease protein